jgi:hypothetical protein
LEGKRIIEGKNAKEKKCERENVDEGLVENLH